MSTAEYKELPEKVCNFRSIFRPLLDNPKVRKKWAQAIQTAPWAKSARITIYYRRMHNDMNPTKAEYDQLNLNQDVTLSDDVEVHEIMRAYEDGKEVCRGFIRKSPNNNVSWYISL